TGEVAVSLKTTQTPTSAQMTATAAPAALPGTLANRYRAGPPEPLLQSSAHSSVFGTSARERRPPQFCSARTQATAPGPAPPQTLRGPHRRATTGLPRNLFARTDFEEDEAAAPPQTDEWGPSARQPG